MAKSSPSVACALATSSASSAARLSEGKIDLATFETPASETVRSLARRVQWEPLVPRQCRAVPKDPRHC
jgi:hypothetical protein